MIKRQIENRSSRTAAYTCFSRGCATRERDLRFRGPDNMAELLFPPLAKIILNITPLRRLFLHTMVPPGIYEYVLARTKVMDDAFLEALDVPFEQIILLGAGFDTRALRFTKNNHGTKIFELDAPSTQQPKIKIFQKRRLNIPPELVFVPIDFNRENIFDVLSNAGFQSAKKCLFLWEGVTMYLRPQAVDDTLEFIRLHSTSGSRVVFDYIDASVLRKENRLYGEKEIFDSISKTGEIWTFGMEQEEVEPFLNRRGFNIIDLYTPADLERKYLKREDGTLFGHINGTHCIVNACVK